MSFHPISEHYNRIIIFLLMNNFLAISVKNAKKKDDKMQILLSYLSNS